MVDSLPQRWLMGLLAAGALVLLAAVPLPLTDGDTALYATVARNALASGEWVIHSFPDGRVFDKPPLTLWFIGGSLAAFGGGDWTVRLWHLLFALATAAATFALARLALPIRQAALAAVILLSSAQFFYQAIVPQQDVPLTLFVTLAVYWYLRWQGEGHMHLLVLAWAAAAFAVLSKGLVGLVLPVLVVSVHILADRPKLPARTIRTTAAGAAIFLILAAPWFILGVLRGGREFIETFFLGGPLGVGRFFRPVLSTPAGGVQWLGYLAYLIFLPLGILPWTGWLWPALREGWSARARAPILRVCALWVISILAFLSVSPGDKVIRFQLPVLPPLAVLLAAVVEDPRWRRPAAWVSGIAALAWAALLVGIAQTPLPSDVAAYLPLVGAFVPPFAGALAAYAVSTFSGRPRQGLVLLATFALISYAFLIAATARHWDRISPWRPLARIVNTAATGEARVLVIGEMIPFAGYYIKRDVEYTDLTGLTQAWRSGPVVAVVPAGAFGSLPPGTKPVIIGSEAGWLVVRNATPP